ncbi:hypothetical protein HF313_15025 [Massilia atriviolacea]|uniref:Phosphoadenosine phosphosulphate reductase domain-containing protein n=1 Tax=Massilia atriviolacea TaxID=2495579 RepID=A0A430HR77_9BURK|nr:hypothetical protein [Massilia atriviolacea]RSZ60025.1 hypothetical protein EJB06_07550 [Massilia atriviolacea]
MTTHIVCYSGGHSSALVAIETTRKHGRDNVMLVNHDMHVTVEDADVKRFKRQVAEYLGLPITFVNYKGASLDQFDVSVESQAFKVGSGSELCTARLKTEPFMSWLSKSFPGKDVVIYYGFDANERDRIQRRTGILGAQGYATAYPLAFGDRTILSTKEIDIEPPLGYSQFKHANCIGCLKAGWQHWYIVYCTRPDIWLKAKWAEEEIGYAIHHDDSGPVYLEDMEAKFAIMKCAGVPQTEHISHQKFWADARKFIKIASTPDLLPCECTV